MRILTKNQPKCKIIVGKRAKKGEDILALAARLVVVWVIRQHIRKRWTA